MELKTLRDLYVDHLKDLYNAETQLVKALPKMAEAASAPELKKAFKMHLTQTEEHVRRLEKVFEGMGQKPTGKTCKAMQGLVEEGEEMIKEKADPEVKDAGLIAAAQKVEHYEISAYGTARTFAQTLGERQAVQTLQTTLEEESQTDEKLTKLAESSLNEKATH